MPSTPIDLVISEAVELNLSYMPFIKGGGLFIPTFQSYILGDPVHVNLHLPGKKDALYIEGKVVWVIPKISLYHVVAGIGIQFIGGNAQVIRNQIEELLDPSSEIGGYSFGIIEDTKRK